MESNQGKSPERGKVAENLLLVYCLKGLQAPDVTESQGVERVWERGEDSKGPLNWRVVCGGFSGVSRRGLMDVLRSIPQGAERSRC